MHYRKVQGRFLLRLMPGEEIMESVTRFAATHHLPHAQVFGLGACEDAELGFFDPEIKDYRRRLMRGRYEVTSLVGNIAWVDEAPFFHAHITLGDAEYRAWTGHLFKAVVTATMELTVLPGEVGEVAVQRAPDAFSGLRLWDLPETL